MNEPSAVERFYLAEGTDKVVYTKDQKIPSAAHIIVRKEDHTMGNIIRCELMNNPAVLFAGYRIPHPLEFDLHFRVQTDGSITPAQAVVNAIDKLEKDITELEDKMRSAIAEKTKKGIFD